MFPMKFDNTFQPGSFSVNNAFISCYHCCHVMLLVFDFYYFEKVEAFPSDSHIIMCNCALQVMSVKLYVCCVNLFF